MKTFKEIHDLSKRFSEDNPDVSVYEAYRQGYIDALRSSIGEPTMATDDIVQDYVTDTIYPTFDDFWKAYGRQQGRKKCEAKWNKLSHAQKMAIMEHVPRYVASTPDVQYRKMPATYLNGECWNDEIIDTNPQRQKPQDGREQEYQYLAGQAELFADLNRKRR